MRAAGLARVERDRARPEVPRRRSARGRSRRVELVPAAVVAQQAQRLDTDRGQDQERRADPQQREAFGQEQQQQRPERRHEPWPPEGTLVPAAGHREPGDVSQRGQEARDRQQLGRRGLVPEPRRLHAQRAHQAGEAGQPHRCEDQHPLCGRREERERLLGHARPCSARGRQRRRRERAERRERPRQRPSQHREAGEAPANDHGQREHERERARARLERDREPERQAGERGGQRALLLLRAHQQQQRHGHCGGRGGLARPGLGGAGERRAQREREAGPASFGRAVAARNRGEEHAGGDGRAESREQLADERRARRVDLERQTGERERGREQERGGQGKGRRRQRAAVRCEQQERRDHDHEPRHQAWPARPGSGRRSLRVGADAHARSSRGAAGSGSPRGCARRASR